jgi:trk system potassium uptake protein TrkA
MYIIIAGGGIAGSTIARELADHKHDIVVIDRDKEICEELYARTGVETVYGDARNIDVLQQAGINKADVVLGALYRDTDNLTVALLARSENVAKIMVKMRDPAYEKPYLLAGVTHICNMNSMLLHKIIVELENPIIKVITALEHGQAQLIMFKIPENWPQEGITVQELAQMPAFLGNCVFAGVLDEKRSKRIIVPRGPDKLYRNNTVFMVTGTKAFRKIEKYLASLEQ